MRDIGRCRHLTLNFHEQDKQHIPSDNENNNSRGVSHTRSVGRERDAVVNG